MCLYEYIIAHTNQDAQAIWGGGRGREFQGQLCCMSGLSIVSIFFILVTCVKRYVCYVYGHKFVL